MNKLIAGNWKMNGLRAAAEAWAGGVAAVPGAALPGVDLMVCPPVTILGDCARLLRGTGIAVGAQDCHAGDAGAHTGDVSAAMLRDAGATAVILGHSERRADHHETDAAVQAKVRAAVGAGLLPIVCVGETEAERVGGHADGVVGRQLSGSIPAGFAGVVAYEPVWAIGTGRTPTEQDVAAMHAWIRAELVRLLGPAGRGVRILYGGSVKPGNAAALMAVPEVGGALVGGASLKAEDFLGIARGAALCNSGAGG